MAVFGRRSSPPTSRRLAARGCAWLRVAARASTVQKDRSLAWKASRVHRCPARGAPSSKHPVGVLSTQQSRAASASAQLCRRSYRPLAASMAQPIGPATVRSSGSKRNLAPHSVPVSLAPLRCPDRDRSGTQRAKIGLALRKTRPRSPEAPGSGYAFGASTPQKCRQLRNRGILHVALPGPCHRRWHPPWPVREVSESLYHPLAKYLAFVDCKRARHLIEERDPANCSHSAFSPSVSPHMLTGP